MEPIKYEIELERTNGETGHTRAALPSLTKGHRLKVPVDRGVYAEVIGLIRHFMAAVRATAAFPYPRQPSGPDAPRPVVKMSVRKVTDCLW
jgi:hypothetical protein